MSEPKRPSAGVVSGAAFLMAVSAIGPGFLTQTTQFTVQLGASLAFAILLSTIVDIGAQLNTWRVIAISRRRGNEVANAVAPGFGWIITAVIVAGSFVFNVGNFSGCALGLDALLGLPQGWGVALSGAIAIGLFLLPQMLKGVDWFSKILGAGMILITLYVVAKTRPPVADATYRAVWPTKLDADAIVTMIGGTIGGYIMFSGAHRMLDGGIAGPENVGRVTWGSIQGIVIAGVMRSLLFLAVLGVVANGADIGQERPVFDAFRAGAKGFGYVLCGLVFWAAAITSVVGCSYTSMSFFSGGFADRRRARMTVAFIVAGIAATLIVRWCGWQATPVLIAAGRINGILLPAILGIVLIAAHRRSIMGEYRHPLWATAFGLAAWLATLFMAGWTVWLMVRPK